jgi:8-oxo-dGTP pyrophosphatase MutT (NUDIX family)
MPSKKIRKQVAALPYRQTDAGGVEFLLITSRETARWVIPKGWPMKGKEDRDAAAQEAWEEAGVRGRIGKRAVGRFEYDKILPDGRLRCSVAVFPLAVELTDFAWPEFGERRRRWLLPQDAAAAVDEADLAKLILKFSRDKSPS